MTSEILGLYPRSKEINQQAAIELFTAVRDVPYALGADGNIKGLFEDDIGGCTRKHLYLLPRLQQLGYKVSIGIAQFDWRELPIPSEILALLKQPIQHHLFLYVGFKKPVSVIDATWDKKMKSIGFPVFDWDGISSTGFTVKTINPRKRNPLILKARAFTSSTLNQLGNINKIQPTSFNDVFNAWLVEMRSITP